MKRWVLKAGSTNLKGLVLENDAPMPVPGPGEVRVRMHSVSLNYRDQFVVQGGFWRTTERDLVPISDGAGEIDAIGSGVDGWAVGDRVVSLYFKDWLSGPPHADMGLGLGASNEDGLLAQYVVLPAKRLARMPTSLSFAEASTLPCAGLTAWSALFGEHPVHERSRVLCVGTGGVSLFALTLARSVGSQVIVTTSQEGKRSRLLSLGASEVVNYKEVADWGESIFKQAGGVDKVVEAAGSLNQSLIAVRPGGEVAIMGLLTSDGAPNPATLMGKGIIVRGVAVGNAEAFADLCRFVDARGIKPVIDRTFTFAQAPEAYEAQASPQTLGKVVITFDGA